jgi:hypothetical protein
MKEVAKMLTTEEYKEAELELTLAEARRGFKFHASVYAVVMTGLIVLNALLMVFTDADFPWAVFPLVGWGVGLGFHYLDAYRGEGAGIRSRQERIERFAKRPHLTA